MKLNVPILSQRDPRWASQRLGTVDGTTIGGYGCIITCMTMLANYYGHNLTPANMDDWLTDNQGYVQGNLYRNDAFHREFSDCFFDNIVFCTAVPAPIDQIKAYLSKGMPVVVMVDFDHDLNDGIQTHFVLVIGEENGDLIINDPWYGDQIFFKARYGNDAQGINQINFFSGKVPSQLSGLAIDVGYNPTFEGQDVMVNGLHYKSIKDKNGTLIWKIETEIHNDPAPVITPVESNPTVTEIPVTTSTGTVETTTTNTGTGTTTTTVTTPPVVKQIPVTVANSNRSTSVLQSLFYYLWIWFGRSKKK